MKVNLTVISYIYHLNYIDDKLTKHKWKPVAVFAPLINYINLSRIIDDKCKMCMGLYLFQEGKREISVSYDLVNLKEENVKSWIISGKDEYSDESSVTFYQACE
jgi:hypothetical protein